MPEEEWSDEEDFSPNSEGDNVIPYSRFQEKASEWGNRMQERVNKQADAKNFAKLAEKGASKTGSATDSKGSNSSFASAIQDARNAENKSGFANNVQGKTLEQVASKSMPGGKMFVNQAKKLGPLGTILIIIGALVGIFAGTQSLAPFGLVANGLDQFNNLRTSMNKRTTYFTRFSMDSSRNVKATRATIFGKEKFKISNSLSKKLQKNNVFYKDEGGVRFLVYEDEKTGKKYGVAANDADADKIPSSVEVEMSDGTTKTIEIDTKVKIDDAMIDSDDFSNAFDRGTRTLKGHIAGWFDDLSDVVHGWLSNSRNRFKDTSDVADDEEIKTKAKASGMDEDIRGDSSSSKYEDNEHPVNRGTDEDPDWYNPTETTDSDGGVKKSDTVGKNPDSPEVRGKIEDSLYTKVKSISAAGAQVANLGCTIMKVYSAINAVIAGIHIANVINYITGFLEAVQRTQTGDAGKNELSYYMTGLSTKANTVDSDGKVIKENTSSLESDAWNQFFSDGTVIVQASDPIAEKYNVETVSARSIANSGTIPYIASEIAAIAGAGTSAAAAYKTCLYIDIAAAASGEIIDLALAFFTGGIGNIIKELLGSLIKATVLNGLVLAVMTLFTSVIVPHIAQWMAMDLISNMAGEDAAYAINSGFNIYLGKEMQISSGLPSTEENLMAHWRAQQEVIAAEAEYERSEKSPFDPTSKYTFLGSIVNSLMPIANTWSSPLTTVSTAMSTVGNSFKKLLPTAKADGEVVFETSLNYDCPNLKNIGLVGDAFCTPYFVTEMDTMGEEPSQIMENVMTDEDRNGGNGNFNWDNVDDAEHNGNPDINPNSELGRWVIACSARQSQFGLTDSNVADAISRLVHTGNETLDSAIQAGVGVLPVVGDIDQIRGDVAQLEAYDWLTGKECLSEQSMNYSRYSEDQRLMESAGIIEQSSVAKFLNEYYEENPLDNSYEGIIARYSGLRKSEVEETLAYIEYFDFIANYNPTTYGPEKYEAPDNTIHFEETEVIASENIVLNKYIVYDDVRNKIKIA